MVLAGVEGPGPVLCSRNVKIVPDKTLKEALAAGKYDVLVCPGGAKGAETLSKVNLFFITSYFKITCLQCILEKKWFLFPRNCIFSLFTDNYACSAQASVLHLTHRYSFIFKGCYFPPEHWCIRYLFLWLNWLAVTYAGHKSAIVLVKGRSL